MCDALLRRRADRRRGETVGVRLIGADVVEEKDGDAADYERKHPQVIGADPRETAAIKTGTSCGRDRHATTKTPLLPGDRGILPGTPRHRGCSQHDP